MTAAGVWTLVHAESVLEYIPSQGPHRWKGVEDSWHPVRGARFAHAGGVMDISQGLSERSERNPWLERLSRACTWKGARIPRSFSKCALLCFVSQGYAKTCTRD